MSEAEAEINSAYDRYCELWVLKQIRERIFHWRNRCQLASNHRPKEVESRLWAWVIKVVILAKGTVSRANRIIGWFENRVMLRSRGIRSTRSSQDERKLRGLDCGKKGRQRALLSNDMHSGCIRRTYQSSELPDWCALSKTQPFPTQMPPCQSCISESFVSFKECHSVTVT